MKLDFEIRIHRGDASPEPEIEVGANRIRIRHSFETAHPCFDFAADARMSAGVLELEIAATPRPEMCAQVVTIWEYRAVIKETPPDATELVILHVAGNVRAEWQHQLEP